VTSPASPRQIQKIHGFSLVEVVLAVGVVSFAFVAILGLLPAGMTQFRQAVDLSVCSQIAQRVIIDAQQTDFNVLTDSTNANTTIDNFTFRAPGEGKERLRYFDEQANEIAFASTTTPTATDLNGKGVIYHVLTRVMPKSNVPRTGSSGSGGVLKSTATVVVQVAYNPSNASIPIDTSDPYAKANAGRNLFAPANGATIKTYCAQVGQNQ
jgi:uncharacterized protein (TIGR02598 family)